MVVAAAVVVTGESMVPIQVGVGVREEHERKARINFSILCSVALRSRLERAVQVEEAKLLPRIMRQAERVAFHALVQLQDSPLW